MAAKEHKERKELLAERGCVRSTSRSMSDISSVVLIRACCGWVCDHSRAPLDCGGRAQRRHRFSTGDRASKAAWRFASRRSPIFFGCGLAALGLCVKVRPDSTALFRLRCLKKLNAFCGAKFAFRELREMKKKPREMPWAAFLKNKLAGRGGTAATEIETTGTAANENQAESAEGVGDRFGDSG